MTNKPRRRFSRSERLVTRRGNYESKINSVSHSARGLAQGAERPSHVDPNIRVSRASLTFAHARVYGIRRIRNELFAKFMQICMDRTRWLWRKWVRNDGGKKEGKREKREGGGKIGCLAYSRTSLTFMNCSRAVLSSFLPFVSLPFLRAVSYRFGAVFREGEILSRRRARLHIESPQ